LSSGAAEPTRRFVSAAAQARLDALGRNAVRQRVPLNGSIAMTHRCHLRCVHCYLGEERFAPPAGGELATAFWLRVLDEAAEAGCLNLVITGGEPLLRADFAVVYEHAIRLGLLVSVFTNGTLVDERVVALLAEWPPQLVEISLYGASAEVYERVTGVPGSHARCLRGTDALVSAGVAVGLKAMILRENQDEIPRMREMARESGLPFRVDPSVSPRLSGDPSPLLQRVPACDAVALEMQDESLLERAAKVYETSRGRAPVERLFGCLAGVTGFHVDARGTLLPCLIASGGYDLRSGSFREGWDGAIARFHDQGLAPGFECHACDRRVLCGVCPAQFALETGSPHRRSDYNCHLGDARLHAIAARRAAAGGEQGT